MEMYARMLFLQETRKNFIKINDQGNVYTKIRLQADEKL